jgi:hypothetical protein
LFIERWKEEKRIDSNYKQQKNDKLDLRDSENGDGGSRQIGITLVPENPYITDHENLSQLESASATPYAFCHKPRTFSGANYVLSDHIEA